MIIIKNDHILYQWGVLKGVFPQVFAVVCSICSKACALCFGHGRCGTLS